MTYYARVNYTADGVNNQYAVPFPYISEADVNVYEGPNGGPYIPWAGTFSFLSATVIQLSSIPANGRRVIVRRETPNTNPIATATTGTLVPSVLNLMKLQSLYVEQELADFDVATELDELLVTITAVTQKVLTANTLTEARAVPTVGQSFSSSQALIMHGQASAGDRGDRRYRWSSGSSATDDGATVIKPDDVSGNGRWLLVPELVKPQFWGAIQDDSTNNAAFFNSALTYAKSVGLPVTVPAGTAYRFSASITPGEGNILQGTPSDHVGETASMSILKSSASKVIDLGTSSKGGVQIKDFRIQPVAADQAGTYGIYGENAYFFQAENLHIRDFEWGIYHEKSIVHTYRNLLITSCSKGAFFAADVGTYNADWFNNLVTLEDCRISASAGGPNLDFQGTGLMCRNCDFSGIPGAGTRASIRIRATTPKLVAAFDGGYFEPTAQAPGGDVFLIEGGHTTIRNFHAQGGTVGNEIENLISAKSGAIVVVESISGTDWFNHFVTADGAGTVVYLLPGCFGAIAAASTQLVETNGGKIVDLRHDKWTDSSVTTLTLTGCTTSPTGNVKWEKKGRTVTMWLPDITGTSNTTAATLTGLPASLTPTSNVIASAMRIIDNGTAALSICRIDSDNKITLFKDATGAAFTNTGTKGAKECVITYVLPGLTP